MRISAAYVVVAFLCAIVIGSFRVSRLPERDADGSSPLARRPIRVVSSPTSDQRQDLVTDAGSGSVSRPSLLIDTARLPHQVILRFANHFGRHSNQLKGVLHAVALARVVARHLAAHRNSTQDVDRSVAVHVVVPPFVLAKSQVPFSAVYNRSAIEASAQPAYVSNVRRVSVHIHDDFESVRSAVNDAAFEVSVEEHFVDFPRRGIPSTLPFPRTPAIRRDNNRHPSPRGSASLSSMHHQLTTRDFATVAAEVAGRANALLAAAAPAPAVVQLLFFELVYYDGVVDQSAATRGGAPGVADDLWAAVTPSPAVERAVERALAAMLSGEGDHAAVFDAVHVRTLEGSCADRMRALARRGKLPFPQRRGGVPLAALEWQCTMARDGFDSIAHRFDSDGGRSERPPPGHPRVFLAVDNPGVRRRLVAQSAGRALVAASPSSTNDMPQSLLDMLVDFWLCVRARRFIGNAASTLSRNVCYVRRARGRLRLDSDVDCDLVIRDRAAGVDSAARA